MNEQKQRIELHSCKNRRSVSAVRNTSWYMQFVIDMTECKWNGATIFWRQYRSGREAP